MKSQKIHLLVIDPQNDFCDIPPALQPFDPLVLAMREARGLPLLNDNGEVQRLAPALPVPGAHNDMLRLAAMIDRLGDKLYDIHVTMDSHNPVDIAHPSWWRNAKGDTPAPFTLISAADVRNGVWLSRNPKLQAYSLKYVESLEANGRYVLIIWPEHCLIGSWGHNVHASVAKSLNDWARRRLEVVNYVTKGSNALTEHYSAVQAEVPDSNDPSTMLNSRLIKTLGEADIILIAGEALSHCVASTVRDIADNFGEENIKKMILLTDCASSVQGFENLGTQFVEDMKRRGMQTALSTDFLL
jgi:nicotinamidase/pyrazinamidase